MPRRLSKLVQYRKPGDTRTAGFLVLPLASRACDFVIETRSVPVKSCGATQPARVTVGPAELGRVGRVLTETGPLERGTSALERPLIGAGDRWRPLEGNGRMPCANDAMPWAFGKPASRGRNVGFRSASSSWIL